MRRSLVALNTALLVVAVSLSGCGGSSSHPVTVFAASSLTNAFAAEASAFTAKTKQQVTFSFAGSQDLAAQIRQGAPADVLATADQKTMQSVDGHLLTSAQVFARNRLTIVTAPGNPKHINGLSDLSRRDLVVVLAASSVPAGKYAEQLLTAARVTVHAKSLEDDVRGVLTKVELGEADAGIVYATDAEAAGAKVTSIALPRSPIASYPIAPLDTRGKAFAAFVLSVEGRAILAKFGFLPPA